MTRGRSLRLLLTLLAVVFGFVLLGLVFGSSSASADEGPQDDGALPVVSALVTQVVAPVTLPPVAIVPAAVVDAVATVTQAAPVATLTAPLTATADGALDMALGDALGSTPVASLLSPIVTVVDATVATVAQGVVPALQLLPGLGSTVAGIAPLAAAASGTAAVAAELVSGTAHGTWPGAATPLGTGGIVSTGVASPTIALLAAAVGAGFFVLLFTRRLRPVDGALPSSPVYETDSSPD